MCGEHPPPRGLTSLPQALARPSRGFGTCITHTHLPTAFWVPIPPSWARGSQVSATTAGTCALFPSPASQAHGICYIYTPSLEGDVDAQCLAQGEQRTKALEPAAPLPPPPCTLRLRWARRLLLQPVRESSVWGSGRGAALLVPERRARAEGPAPPLLQGSERPSGQAPRAP